MNITKHTFFETHALLVARVLIGGMFLLAGISKFQDITGTAGYIESVGLPAGVALAWLAAIFEAVLGACIIVGYCIRDTALYLAIFTFLISFPFHGPGMWETSPLDQIMFMKNMAIVGGLLFIVAHGAGKSWTLKGNKAATDMESNV